MPTTAGSATSHRASRRTWRRRRRTRHSVSPFIPGLPTWLEAWGPVGEKLPRLSIVRVCPFSLVDCSSGARRDPQADHHARRRPLRAPPAFEQSQWRRRRRMTPNCQMARPDGWTRPAGVVGHLEYRRTVIPRFACVGGVRPTLGIGRRPSGFVVSSADRPAFTFRRRFQGSMAACRTTPTHFLVWILWRGATKPHEIAAASGSGGGAAACRRSRLLASWGPQSGANSPTVASVHQKSLVGR